MSCAPLPADPVRRVLADDSVSEAPPHEIAKELGELGALGMHLQGYDCAGAMRDAHTLSCAHALPLQTHAHTLSPSRPMRTRSPRAMRAVIL